MFVRAKVLRLNAQRLYLFPTFGFPRPVTGDPMTQPVFPARVMQAIRDVAFGRGGRSLRQLR
ncbi:hypothetical protein CNECB9_2470018 [Cupriavidus necator]|uniref:Uncharacterized protein n=1 Tax=Cupriavidus necator TaxID=106590 RepID=A0A1K0IEE3_CUPNE|nr:hypothetical protein CNECB9_2470018 [Cupriavidus necator]